MHIKYSSESLRSMQRIKGILLIDDDHITNFITTRLFKKIGISNVHVITNGWNALEFLKDCSAKNKKCPELILLDINMPILDGFEFMSGFKNLTFKNPNRIQIVVVTTSKDPRDIQKMKTLGITNFINKPLTLKSLLKILENHPVLGDGQAA
jgi:CheY-like chemotaxis protein